jgi:putative FmdB family regulatory protein
MPLYDYQCDQCGSFRDWRSMSESGTDVDCPTCGEVAPRAITAPFLPVLARNTRIAHERNEKSAHEPQVMTRKQLDGVGKKRGHGHGVGHGHDHHQHGKYHVHRSSRPWMIGH